MATCGEVLVKILQNYGIDTIGELLLRTRYLASV